MATPLDIRIEWEFAADQNGRIGQLSFTPQVEGFEYNYSRVHGIGLWGDDEPNEIFLTTDAAEAHYLADSYWINTVVNNMNADTGITDYVFRDLIRVPGRVHLALNEKQDIITPSAHTSDAATNAATDLTGLTVGELTDEVNATNTKYNDLATKFNTLLDQLEAQGLKTP